MALNKGRVAPDCCQKTDGLGVVRNEDRHAADTDAGGVPHEAVVRNAGVRIKRERNVEVLPALPRRRLTRLREALMVGPEGGKSRDSDCAVTVVGGSPKCMMRWLTGCQEGNRNVESARRRIIK